MEILIVLVLVGFLTPWQWLLRGVALFGALMLHLLILDAQTRCDGWNCDLGAAIVFGVFVVIGFFLFLRSLMIKCAPALAMYGVGARWLWVGDFCVLAMFGSILGLLIFVRLIWAFAGVDDTVAHLSLFGLVFGSIGISIVVFMRFGVRLSGVSGGVAVMLLLGTLVSLSFPTTVLTAAETRARRAYCIYFPKSDRFYESGGLTLLTMEKSTDAYWNRHAILVWENAGEVRTAYWSFGQEQFVTVYQYGNHPVPIDKQAQFKACLSGVN